MSDEQNPKPPEVIIPTIVEEKKKPYRRDTTNDPLQPKQKRFARLVAQGMSKSEAVVKAGYHPQNKDSAKSLGNYVARNPKVAAEINRQIEILLPNVEETVMKRFKQALEDPNTSLRDFLAVSDRIGAIKGWDAPKKSAHIKAITSIKLPKQG